MDLIWNKVDWMLESIRSGSPIGLSMHGIILSTDCVHASSVNMFKNRIDKYLGKVGYTKNKGRLQLE